MSPGMQRYLEHGYEFNDLMERHDLEDEGLWIVKGEDGNCDLRGPRSIAVLGYVRGKLGDVLEWAVEQPRFFSWGGGGRIEEIEVLDLS